MGINQMSNKIWAAFIVVVVVVAVGGYLIGSMTAEPEEPEFALPSEIPIGYVHSATVQVPLADTANAMAIEDINNFVQESGIPVKFVLWEENAEESATKAVERIETLIGRGAKVIIGPAWSSQCKAALKLIEERQIVLISCCSSSTGLAITGDNLFRMAPDTSKQALVFIRLFLDRNIKAVIPVVVQEEYSVSLFGEIEKAMPAGIEIYESTPLDPEKTEFIGEFEEVDSQYKDALGKYERGEIGIAIFSANGGSVYGPILNSMARYTELMQAKGRVFGCDVGGAGGLLDYASEAASKVEFIAYSPAAATRSPNFIAWKDRFEAQAGFEPEYHGFLSYDGIWVAALSILAAGKYDGPAVAAVIPTIAANHYGISGWCVLNEAGDRQYPMFNVFSVVEGEWKIIGLYDGVSDAIIPSE